MEVKTILVYHPNGRDAVRINETDFVQGTHKLFNAPVEQTAPDAPKAPASTGNDLKGKLMAFDPNLATEEGILAVADETYDNQKTCALADLLGIKYKQQTKRDDIRKQNFETLSKLFKK